MAIQEESSPAAGRQVLVHIGDSQPVAQPAMFRCCPLGVQFYAQRQVPKYRILDIKLCVSDPNDVPPEISCSGVVVHCQETDGPQPFRVWVYFIDLPDQVRNYLHCFAKESDSLCPHCENF